ncbi:MAG: adenylate/guanylate cyclase domain-containing protein [Anaerolineales bacterium]|nr:adenylate/guanylate cyclase domain-containing protein [Anaerolineales bacterium]
MKSKFLFEGWLAHLLPLATACVALAMLVLTPFWAYQWFRQPFLGVLLEPNNIVSSIRAEDWPAAGQGAEWPYQLTRLAGQPVADAAQVEAVLIANGYAPLEAAFVDENGGAHVIQVTPIHAPLKDLVTLFVIPYLVGLTFWLIGMWAYRLRGNLRAGRAFLSFAAAVSMATATFFDMNTSHHAVLVWALGLFVASDALVHLALVFPQQMPFVDRWPLLRFASWPVTILLAIPAAREMLYPSDPRAYIQTWQVGYAYMAVTILLFLATLTLRVFRGRSPMVRQQSRVIVFGAAIAFAPMMIFYLIPTALSSQPPAFNAALYFPLLILLPLTVTYAILRYRLLDVDLILSKALTYTLMTAVALALFYALLTLISFALQGVVHPDNPLLIALYLLLLVLGLSPLRALVQRLIDRLFYRAPADYRRVLNTLSSSLVITPDIERTLQLLREQLQQALAPEEFLIYLYDDDRLVYQAHAQGGADRPVVQADDALVGVLQSASGAVWFPPASSLPPELAASPAYPQLFCSAFVPLRYEGRLIGFMALGLRRSGDPYTSDDLDFLTTVAGQSTLALENARLFANLRRTLDQTLEMKNLMDDIFASIATGVITTDLGRKITLFNQAAVDILGIPLAEAMGKSLSDALPSFNQELEMVVSEALDHGAITLSKDVTQKMPPRGDLYLRLSCAPLRDAYLGTKGATIVFEDLTESRKLKAEQERIRQTFGRMVAPRVRDRLLSDPSHLRLDGTRQVVTILFADLCNFTPFSEVTSPEILFKVLNSYLSLAAQAILEEEGTLDKFMGDAVLALWNTPDPQPDHALRAVRAALSLLERSQQADVCLEDGSQRLQFRIGVTTGEAMVGNVGTSELFNYTAIGDTVNLAQRLEVTAQPGQILIDQATYEIVADKVMAKPLDPMQVKGRSQPVAIYELKGFIKPQA